MRGFTQYMNQGRVKFLPITFPARVHFHGNQSISTMSHSPSAPLLPNGDENSPGGFPTVIERFGDDPRISWSRLDNKWVLESDDGAEFHFDDALKRWIPVVSVLLPLLYFLLFLPQVHSPT